MDVREAEAARPALSAIGRKSRPSMARMSDRAEAEPITFRARSATAPLARRHLKVLVPLGDQVLVSASNFATTALIARCLGLEAFGLYAMVWIAISLAFTIQLGLIVSPMMSIASKQTRTEQSTYLGSSLVHHAAFIVDSVAALYAFVDVSDHAHVAVAITPMVASLAGATYLMQDFARRLLFTMHCGRGVLLMDLVHQSLRISSILVIWHTRELSIDDVLWVMAGAALASTACAVPFATWIRFDRATFRASTMRQWRSARWLTGTGLMQWAAGNSALIVTGSLLGATTMGGLRSMQNILNILNVVREAMENIVPQQAGRAIALHGVRGLRRLMTRIFIAIALVSLVVVLSLALYGREIVHALYGEDFEKYAFYLQCSSVLFPIALIICTLTCTYRAFERTSYVFLSSIVAVALNLTLMTPAITGLGISGALVVNIATDCTLCLSLLFHLRAIRFVDPVIHGSLDGSTTP